MTPADKAPPPGALEEAVALFDELLAFSRPYLEDPRLREGGEGVRKVADLERRRAALEPRLAKRRENQAKGRGGKP